MSGTNPFRRRDTANSSHLLQDGVSKPASDKEDTQTGFINVDVSKSTRSKTGKTVRINPIDTSIPSPILPSSPLLNCTTREDIREGGIENEDPFRAPDHRDSVLPAGERWHRETMAGRENSERHSKPSELHMPTNPFKKTPAILEVEAVTEEPKVQEGGPKLSKSQYNVDDFKRLLMTGERPSSISMTDAAAATVLSQGQPAPGDNSSNADTSSVSRQSLFESATYSVYESPRTSQEISVSDDERQGLVADSGPRVGKIKPSTPRHRHGKLVKSNAPPQVVPFEDPTFSSIVEASSTSISSETPTPITGGSLDNAQQPFPASFQVKEGNADISEPPAPNINSQAQKKPPPAPPASRRHGQIRPKSFIADSSRSSPISEEVYADTVAHSSSPPSNIVKPAPPPPRRSGAFRQDSSSSVQTSASAITSSGQSPPTSIPPATPPTRSPSLKSTKRPPQVPSQSSSPSMPPPPPPRRRGSSQSSHTLSRLNGDYRISVGQRPRGDSGASSISQLQMTPIESSAEKKDVLADLSALQREVDELRGKMRD